MRPSSPGMRHNAARSGVGSGEGVGVGVGVVVGDGVSVGVGVGEAAGREVAVGRGWVGVPVPSGMDGVVQAARSISMTMPGRKTIFLTSEWILILPPRIICAEGPNGLRFTRTRSEAERVGCKRVLGGDYRLTRILTVILPALSKSNLSQSFIRKYNVPVSAGLPMYW